MNTNADKNSNTRSYIRLNSKIWLIIMITTSIVIILSYYSSSTFTFNKWASINTTEESAGTDLCYENDARRYYVTSDHADSNLTLDREPKCIDGSRPAFYFRKGMNRYHGQSKWLVYFEGGGWCFNLKACYERSKTILGSSREYPMCLPANQMNHFLSQKESENPFMFSWNIVHVKYCDGGSYAGDIDIQYNVTIIYILLISLTISTDKIYKLIYTFREILYIFVD